MTNGKARESVWQTMRELGSFTSNDLAKKTEVSVNGIQKFIAYLARAGVIEKTARVRTGRSGRIFVWRLIKDLGSKAPVIKKAGNITVAKNARERAWQSMRMARRFTLPEIVATAEIGANNLNKYVIPLCKAGYLRVLKKPTGQKGEHGVYQLIKNSGPHAPRVGNDKTVWDFNKREEINYE